MKYLVPVLIGIGCIMVVLLLVWGNGALIDHQTHECIRQGGSPVMWNGEVQCLFNGVPLRK